MKDPLYQSIDFAAFKIADIADLLFRTGDPDMQAYAWDLKGIAASISKRLPELLPQEEAR